MTDINLRSTMPEDMEFLCRVYASTRTEELALTDWSDDQKAAFLRMQFDAQHRYYLEHYAQAQRYIIELDGAPAGRLYLDYRAAEVRIVDIALLPEFRSRGVGTQLLRDVLTEGQRRNLPVTIHVEQFNPALRLYERLGFRRVEDRGVYFFLEWRPPNDLEAHEAAAGGERT
jgi:ribosomal protein S18 acetylase RimI-like enzyme